MNGQDLGRAGGAGERDGIIRDIVPDLRLAVAPADDNRRAGLMVERRAQVRAVDVRDGAGAADIGRDLAVARFDFIAQDMPLVVGVTIRAGFQIHAQFLRKDEKEHLF